MLLILGVWRHIYKRFPLIYDPLYWGAVFPLGMYAVSTAAMADQFGFAFLEGLPVVFFWLAFAAWLTTLAALVASLLRRRR